MIWRFWIYLLISILSFIIGKKGKADGKVGKSHKKNHRYSHNSHLHDVDSPEFRALADATYQRVVPCVNSTWLLQDKAIQFRFPTDAQTHYEDLLNKTYSNRTAPIHQAANYSGPWIENLYISRFLHRPLSFFRGLIPLFIQWVDIQNLGDEKFEELHASLKTFLRPDVLYVTVSQSAIGLGKITKSHPNILVLSAGGFGHCAIPLVKGELEPIPLPKTYEVDIGFYGTNNESRANRPEILRSVLQTAQEVQLSYRERSGSNWKADMASTKFNLCPRGYGRTSYRLAESIQLGRIPVYIYNDYPWLPFSDFLPFDSFGFLARLNGTTVNTVPEVIRQLKSLSEEDYQQKLRQLHRVRRLFTYRGILEQLELFFRNPFGPKAGYLTCTSLPPTER